VGDELLDLLKAGVEEASEQLKELADLVDDLALREREGERSVRLLVDAH
jgi:hypothetical protein